MFKVILSFFGVIFFLSDICSANLLISPTRVFFRAKERTKEVTVKNTSNQSKSYKITFKNLIMDENGIYKPVSEGVNFADKYIRYSPRIVTLPPGQSQTVRLLLRRRKGMEESEYRSHLSFKELPPNNYGNSIGKKNKETKTQLLTLIEVTIPVLVKNKPDQYLVKLNQLELIKKESRDFLKVNFAREGKSSAYGNVSLTFKGNNSNDEIKIGELTRFFVYYPGRSRKIDIPLQIPEGILLKNGTIQVYYNKMKEQGGNLIAFASLGVK